MKIIDVDRIDGDVVVTFEDGMTVLYPHELLREMMPRGQVVPPPEPEPEE
jgi:hypothetical protein